MFLCSHTFLELYSGTMVKLVGNSLVLLDLAFKICSAGPEQCLV